MNIVKANIDLSKSDWDSFETSWDFAANLLVVVETSSDEPHPADNDTDGTLLQVPLSASWEGRNRAFSYGEGAERNEADEVIRRGLRGI